LIGIPIAGILFSHTATTVFNAMKNLVLKQGNYLSEVFRELDADGNASLTLAEIKRALMDAGATVVFSCV
jgi:Ca2+-binding EF-hand superfamily protein